MSAEPNHRSECNTPTNGENLSLTVQAYEYKTRSHNGRVFFMETDFCTLANSQKSVQVKQAYPCFVNDLVHPENILNVPRKPFKNYVSGPNLTPGTHR